jgi:HD-GYP domain-containing protein (c-di-GMP phosphodiesterase class II)
MAECIYSFRPSPRLAGFLRRLRRSYKTVAIDRHRDSIVALESPAVFLADAGQGDLARLAKFASAWASAAWRLVYLLDHQEALPPELKDRVFAVLPRKAPFLMVERAIASAFENLAAAAKCEQTALELHRAVTDLGTLNNIGVALSNERNTDALLELILTKSREITCCDAGSLYLVEEEPEGGKHLVFKLTQNDSHAAPFTQFTLPINTQSIAGYAAATGKILNIKDAYRILHLPFRLNRDLDRKYGYRTKSMLVVPMQNQKNEVIGVLQLINAKMHADARLTTRHLVHQEVIPFSKRSQELAASLASQAAVALENNLLYRDIQRLFEGFVKASVTAIESRDPTTFGHSERVATLTVGLAEVVDREETGGYRDVRFSRVDIQELRYASLLHDFGKVGVREEVLVKAKKLYPAQMSLVHKRFQYIKKVLELEDCRKKLDYVLRHGNQDYAAAFAACDAELGAMSQQLEDFLQHILQANEPTVLPEKTSEKLTEIAGWTFQGPDAPGEALLSPDELRLLSIPKGSLDPEERLQIESHVIHSFRFLSQIPWTKELRRIPDIARGHHEKLDGSGYPYHMKDEEIPFQSKIMTIADIFDALTARDRPYKRAVPVERALDIIGQEVKSQLIDPELFRLFLDAKIFKLTSGD